MHHASIGLVPNFDHEALSCLNLTPPERSSRSLLVINDALPFINEVRNHATVLQFQGMGR